MSHFILTRIDAFLLSNLRIKIFDENFYQNLFNIHSHLLFLTIFNKLLDLFTKNKSNLIHIILKIYIFTDSLELYMFNEVFQEVIWEKLDDI